MDQLARTEEEINEQIGLAVESSAEGRSRWPNMTFEQGVDQALRWVVGEAEDAPMSD